MSKVITMAAWRRPDYFKKVLDGIVNNPEHEEYGIIISIDGGYPEETKEMRNICLSHKLSKQIRVHISNTNLGCAANTYMCTMLGFMESDYVIHLEDDTVPGKDFLRYMEWAGEEFKDNKEIFSVNAFNRLEPSTQLEDKDFLYKVESRKLFTCIGWAIWRRIWEEMETKWFGIHWSQEVYRKGINVDTIDAAKEIPEGEEFLKYIIKADNGSWCWPMNKYWRKGRKEIYPVISRVQNIGFDNRGTWSPGGDFHISKHYAPFFVDDYELDNSKEYTQ
jgi:hypothetical protein